MNQINHLSKILFHNDHHLMANRSRNLIIQNYSLLFVLDYLEISLFPG